MGVKYIVLFITSVLFMSFQLLLRISNVLNIFLFFFVSLVQTNFILTQKSIQYNETLIFYKLLLSIRRYKI